MLASITDIVALGHANSASERPENGVANHSYCARHSAGESNFNLSFSKEIHTMDSSSKTALVIAFAVIALLLLLFGGGMATGTMFSGGMMGSGSMGGISWMWLPTLLVVVLGIALFSAISGKK
jgi:hypothetical protein